MFVFAAFITGSVRVSEGIGAEKSIVIGDYAGNVTRLDKDENIRVANPFTNEDRRCNSDRYNLW